MEAPPHPMRLGDDEKAYYVTSVPWPGGAAAPRRRPAAVGADAEAPRPGCRSTPTRTAASQVRPGRGPGDDHAAAASCPRRDRHLLDPRPDRAGRRASAWCSPATPIHSALFLVMTMACARRLLRRPGGAVPRRGADHRLHRRDHDPLPVRAHAGRPGLQRLDRGDAARAAGGRDRLRHRLRRAGRRRHLPGRCEDTPLVGLADANAGGGNVIRRSPSCCSPSTCSPSSSPRRC